MSKSRNFQTEPGFLDLEKCEDLATQSLSSHTATIAELSSRGFMRMWMELTLEAMVITTSYCLASLHSKDFSFISYRHLGPKHLD